MIRPATPADAAAIAAIYNHYVRNTIVTFEEEAVGTDDMAARIREIADADLPWLVWVEDGRVLGYAYAGKWKSRCAYRYSVELTVYLDPGATRRGLGTGLYQAILAGIRPKQIHGAIGGIALPNAGSVALHEKLGFQQVAHFKEVGWKFGHWIDVGYWELIL